MFSGSIQYFPSPPESPESKICLQESPGLEGKYPSLSGNIAKQEICFDRKKIKEGLKGTLWAKRNLEMSNSAAIVATE